MSMAINGSKYSQIIDFYYSNVMITDIKNAVIPRTANGISSVKPAGRISIPKPKGGL